MCGSIPRFSRRIMEIEHVRHVSSIEPIPSPPSEIVLDEDELLGLPDANGKVREHATRFWSLATCDGMHVGAELLDIKSGIQIAGVRF
jgi:hypothetical protein